MALRLPGGRRGHYAGMESPRRDAPTPPDAGDAVGPARDHEAAEEAEAEEFDAAIDQLGGEEDITAG